MTLNAPQRIHKDKYLCIFLPMGLIFLIQKVFSSENVENTEKSAVTAMHSFTIWTYYCGLFISKNILTKIQVFKSAVWSWVLPFPLNSTTKIFFLIISASGKIITKPLILTFTHKHTCQKKRIIKKIYLSVQITFHTQTLASLKCSVWF